MGLLKNFSLQPSAFSASIEPPNRIGLDTPYQPLFHIVDTGRDADGDQGRAFARLDRAELMAEAQGPGALCRGALEEPPRRDVRRELVDAGELPKQVEILDTGQAVGADGDAHT